MLDPLTPAFSKTYNDYTPRSADAGFAKNMTDRLVPQPQNTMALTLRLGARRAFRATKESAGQWVTLILIYLILEYAGITASARSAAGTVWNLSFGLCLAAVFREGYRGLVPVLIGSMLADILFRNTGPATLYSLWLNVMLVAKTIVPVVAGRLISNAAKAGFLSNRWAGVLLFAIPISLVASAFHAGFQLISETEQLRQLWENVAQLWIGDLSGILVIAPLGIVFSQAGAKRLVVTKGWAWEAIAQVFFAAALLWFVFIFNAENVREYFYILTLPLIWISLRHGVRGTTIMNAALLITLIVFLSVYDNDGTQAAQLPTRMLVLVVTALALGMTVDENRSAARRLRAREQELSTNLKAGETSELAGTLAHELSHPLGAISNYSAVIKHKLDRQPQADPDLIEIVSRLRQEVRRATETIQRLREFFRSGSLRLERVDIAQIARESVMLLSNKLEATDVSIRITNATGPTYVSADGIQLHSVIHNLIVNAIDELRLSSSSQKIISITIQREIGQVRLIVEDSGSGVAPDIADHIFEPMTTTKRDGLGLGLSMSKSIIQAHGGKIGLDKSRYGGARFTVTLPTEAA